MIADPPAPVLEQPLTAADVTALYRLFLRRDPESEAVVRAATGTPAADFVRGLLGSREYRRLAVNQLTEDMLAELPPGRVETAATDEQLAALLDHARATWIALGDGEPYWSVLTHDDFRGQALASDVLERSFFDSGRAEVALFAAACARNGLSLATHGTVLDFGCGVARLGVHLAPLFARYIGVDISAPHLRLAAHHLTQAGLADYELLPLPEFLDTHRAIDVDAFFSVIVLQHNAPPLIALLLRRLIACLRSGGIGYFQVPRALFDYAYAPAEHIARMDASAGMEMHAMPQAALFRLIADGGCDLIECLPDGKTGGCGLSMTYLIRKR